jgi:hypothetical protein
VVEKGYIFDTEAFQVTNVQGIMEIKNHNYNITKIAVGNLLMNAKICG